MTYPSDKRRLHENFIVLHCCVVVWVAPFRARAPILYYVCVSVWGVHWLAGTVWIFVRTDEDDEEEDEEEEKNTKEDVRKIGMR